VTDDERCAIIDQAFATLERLDRRLPRPLSGPSVIRRPHQEPPQGRRGPSDAEIEQLRGRGCMGSQPPLPNTCRMEAPFGQALMRGESKFRARRWRDHIRLLAPLAFVSPRIIAAIVDGTPPSDLTVTGLAKGLPYSWAEQEQGIGLDDIQVANRSSLLSKPLM
jgi:hypothetical protein